MIVGVNKYKLEKEDSIDVLVIDNKEVKEKQLARLGKVKSSRDPEPVERALKALEDSAR